jgi:transcriptional regulator with XRE-family HTH domain
MLREILTQRDVAKSVGCSQAAVSGWVRGTHLPNTLDYPRLLELFPADEKKLRRAYEQDFRERHS